jgi:hypothetical protein
MRKVLIVLIGLSVIGAIGCGAPSRSGPLLIDLNLPDSMNAVARANPDHHAKIQRILLEVRQWEPSSVPNWLKTEFGANEIEYMPLLKTSDPAKRYLAFTLDKTRYEVVLVEARTLWSDPKR